MKRGSMGGAVVALIILAAAVAARADGFSRPDRSTPAADPLIGFWSMAADQDVFYFEFTSGPDGRLQGVVHSTRGGVKYAEVAAEIVDWSPPHLVLRMDPHDIRFEGTADLDAGTITGRLLYPAGGGMDVVLRRADPAGLPELRPRPADAAPYVYRPPAAADDGWPTTTAADAGIDPDVLTALVREAAAGAYGELHSLLAARGGRLFLEEYFYGYDRDRPHPTASVTKSVASLLVGLAVDAGEIRDLDVPVLDFFPDRRDAADPGWRGVTLEHVLSMSTGVRWPQDEEDAFYASDDPFAAILARAPQDPPGTRWDYVNPPVQLLAGVLYRATGLHADELAAARLFAPLGITDWNWDYGRRDGHPLLTGSLALRPRDMAKLGQLVLDDGLRQGRRVVSAEWIRESTRRRFDADPPFAYGLLWWRVAADGPGGPVEAILANGWGSQFIAILPAQDLVLVTTGGNQDNGRHTAPLTLFRRLVLEGIRDGR